MSEVPVDLWEGFLKRYGLTTTELAGMLRMHRRTVQRWKNQKYPVRWQQLMLRGLANEMSQRNATRAAKRAAENRDQLRKEKVGFDAGGSAQANAE